MSYHKQEGQPPEYDYKNWQATEESVRSPVNNRRRTRALFRETMNTTQLKQYAPVYTLCEQSVWEPYHGVWLPSAKQIYLHSVDEYDAARRMVGSVEHWNYLIKLDWFVEGTDDHRWTSLSQWREEHQFIKESEALRRLWQKADEGNVAAIKALLDHQRPIKRGRPSKNEVEGEKKKAAKTKSEFDEDHSRVLNLVRNNGK